MDDWLTGVQELMPQLSSVRRHLHQNPEAGFDEKDTARFISEFLQTNGIPFERVGETGIVATLDSNRAGGAIALRADIDALAISEASETEYASQRPGVMHACGHDCHTAILMLTAKFLKEHMYRFCGTVKFLFQAAEEVPPGGAVQLIEAGALEGIDAIYALHVSPEMVAGQISVRNGAMLAAADQFHVEVVGRGGHGASPHQTVDAVMIACQLVNNLQTIVSRNLSPLEPAVISVGQINAGHRPNVIAETCTMEGTVRTLSEETRNRVRDRLKKVIQGTAEMHGAEAIMTYEEGYPPLINPEPSADIIRQVGHRVLGPGAVQELEVPSMGGEDFAYYLQRVPGAFFRLGTKTVEREQFPLHNPRFDLDEGAMVYGVKMFAGLVDHHLGA